MNIATGYWLISQDWGKGQKTNFYTFFKDNGKVQDPNNQMDGFFGTYSQQGDDSLFAFAVTGNDGTKQTYLVTFLGQIQQDGTILGIMTGTDQNSTPLAGTWSGQYQAIVTPGFKGQVLP